MLTWSRYTTPFGDGAVVLRDAKIIRVMLPLRDGRRLLKDAVASAHPGAVEDKTDKSVAERYAQALAELFDGRPIPKSVLAAVQWPETTEYRLAVLKACARIPFGSVRTYGELARDAGYPGSARAVGTTMATNELPLLVPCHRVVRAGSLGHYGAGPDMKEFLLRAEGAGIAG